MTERFLPSPCFRSVASSSWGYALLLLFFGAATLIPNLSGWDLWNPDEPRYAQVAREMIDSGNYLVPHLNAEVYPDKPPVFFWLIAACSRPFHEVTATAARLPSALAALAVIVLTYALGRRMFDRITGLFAGISLLTTVQFFWLARRANIDMTLTMLTTLALFLFYCGYTGATRHRWWFLLSYACMGLAVLTKGPVGLIIPLATIIVFLVSGGEARRLKEIHVGKGLAIAVGIVLLWLIPACWWGGQEYTHSLLFKQNLGRVVDSYSHKRPFYYYLINFPADFLPWTFFLPSAAAWFWRNRRKSAGPGVRFSLGWFLTTFIFFSVISGKRNLYLLPLYPAASLMMGHFWSQMFCQEKGGRPRSLPAPVSVPFLLFFGASLLAGAALTVLSLWKLYPSRYDLSGLNLMLLAGILLAGGLLGVIVVRRVPRLVFSYSLLVLLMVSMFIIGVTHLLPFMNKFKSARPFCETIQRTVGPLDALFIFRSDPETFNYFLDRVPIPVITEEAMLHETLRTSKNAYVIIQENFHRDAPAKVKQLAPVLAKADIGHRTYYLIGTPKGASADSSSSSLTPEENS